MKATTFRHKLSPKLLKLPSSYRTTAWAEAQLPSARGQGQQLEIARFRSSTAGTVAVYASQTGDGVVSEIGASEFYRLLKGDA